MNTGQVEHAISKNNSAHRKNREANGICRPLTINQSFIQPLRTTLSYQHFQRRYFSILSAIVQGLFLFMLRRLEQACIFNGAD